MNYLLLRYLFCSIVIGEGGSGGALALAMADQVWMLENSIYSVLSPEGFASILWKDAGKAREAAQVMRLTAGDLKKLGIVEHVFSEKEPLTRANMTDMGEKMDQAMVHSLDCTRKWIQRSFWKSGITDFVNVDEIRKADGNRKADRNSNFKCCGNLNPNVMETHGAKIPSLCYTVYT